MNNYKKPKRNQARDQGDGFISSTRPLERDGADIRRKFSKSYKPQKKAAPVWNTDVHEISRQGEGFTPRTTTIDDIDMSTGNALSFSLEDEKPQKKGFFRKRNRRTHRHTGRKIARAFGVSFVAVVLGVSSLFAYGYLKARNIFNGNGEGAAALQENVDPSRLNGEGDGRVNILLLGKGGPGHEAPDLTDTILLASIDPVANEAALLSVPRDMFVENVNGSGTKINAVYSNAKQNKLYENGGDTAADIQAGEDAGLSAIKQSVTEVLGVPVHYYVMVDFDAFKNAINTVGGITVDVEEPLYDQSVAWLLGGNPLVAGEGLQTFDGDRALLYARSRKGSARGDFDRTERQREIIVALQQKVLSVGTFANPLKVVELLDNLGDNVRTDLNGLSEVKRLYEIGQGIGPNKIISVGLADPPNILVRTDFIANQSVVLPVEGLYQYDDIKSYVRNTLRDPFLKREDARIVILNGTSVGGLASATEKELKSYGYNVVSIGDAPEGTYEQSLLVDVSDTEKPYTQSYLQRRIGLQVSNPGIPNLPGPDVADFVIILGNDEANKATAN